MAEKDKTVYVKNPHGVVSAVPESMAKELLKQSGWEKATREEWEKQAGVKKK